MKNPKLWISLGLAGLLFVGVMLLAPHARATNKPPSTPPTPIVIVQKERDYTAALTAAAITFFIMRRQARKRRPEPVVVVPPGPLTCEPVVERVLEACGVSK